MEKLAGFIIYQFNATSVVHDSRRWKCLPQKK